MDTPTFAWTSVLLLGVWHGVNPGMGWLFAVALGMQHRQRRAVWRALLPLAAGHAIAIAGTVIVAGALGLVLPRIVLTWFVAVTLVAFGVLKLFSSRHPRYGGMRVTPVELTTWSALMATAHGAGLMVVPFVLGNSAVNGQGHTHAAHMAAVAAPGVEAAVTATLVHTVGYLLLTGLLAVIVYERLGLTLLRRLWVNLDLVWAIALIATGLLAIAPTVSRAQASQPRPTASARACPTSPDRVKVVFGDRSRANTQWPHAPVLIAIWRSRWDLWAPASGPLARGGAPRVAITRRTGLS